MEGESFHFAKPNREESWVVLYAVTILDHWSLLTNDAPRQSTVVNHQRPTFLLVYLIEVSGTSASSPC